MGSEMCIRDSVGPLIFTEQDAPRYTRGFVVVAVTSIVAGMLALVYRGVCMWVNRRRDKAGVLEGFENAYDDDLTDMKVSLITLRRSPVFGSNTWSRILNSATSCSSART